MSNAAAILVGAEHLGDRRLETLVSVGDRQLRAPKTMPRQLSEEGCPERSRFGGAFIEAESLAPAIRVDAKVCARWLSRWGGASRIAGGLAGGTNGPRCVRPTIPNFCALCWLYGVVTLTPSTLCTIFI